MDIEEFMQMLSNARKENCGNLTIGKALEQLRQFPKDCVIVLDKHGFKQIDSENCYYDDIQGDLYLKNYFDSYRGYYEDGYIGISTKNRHLTVENLIELLKVSKEKGVMYGYKGGEYAINDNVVLWLSPDSSSCIGIYPTKFMQNQSDNTVLMLTDYKN